MRDYESDPTFLAALEWFALIKDEHVSEAALIGFERWIAADPAHGVAYDHARELWDRFAIVKPEYDRLHQAGHIGRRGMLLGGLATLVGAPTLYMLARHASDPDYVTRVGERATYSLPDGSVAEIGSNSALSMDFTPERRQLILHRGEGFFRVAADRQRPFMVRADSGSIEALGTAFNVKRTADRVLVSVAEHSVKVETPKAMPIILQTGWQVGYGASGVQAPRQVDLTAVLAWQQDRLIAEDAPLRQVLAELERYRRGPILLANSAIGDILVTAIFDTRRTDKALQIIADTLPVRVATASDYLAVVYTK